MAGRHIVADKAAHLELAHFVLRTSDLEGSLRFWKDLLGMVPNAQSPGGAALSHDGEHHRIALALVPPAAPGRDPRGPGLEHVAFKFKTLSQLLGNYRRAKRVGLEPFMAIHHGGTLSSYYLGPDGVQVEVFVDTQVSDLSIEYFHSPKFAANPIGVPVDFEDLAQRYEAGEAISSLLEMPPMRDGMLEELLVKVQAARAAAV